MIVLLYVLRLWRDASTPICDYGSEPSCADPTLWPHAWISQMMYCWSSWF